MSDNPYLKHPKVKDILFNSFSTPGKKFQLEVSATDAARLLAILEKSESNSKDFFIRQTIRALTSKNNLEIEKIFLDIAEEEEQLKNILFKG
jgi:hypothetical protein